MRGFLIACSLFTRWAVWQTEWDDESLSESVLFLPVIGLVIGALEAGMLFWTDYFRIPSTARALVYVMAPILLTGGIHLDGLIDTADARNSFGDTKKKHEILKDPHIGAFGMIRFALYLLAVLALVITALEKWRDMPALKAGLAFGAPFVASRCLVAVEVFFLRPYEALGYEGMLGALRKGMTAKHRIVAMLELLVATVALFFVFSPVRALAVIFLEGILFLYYRHFSYKEFCGISGDLCGWYLCMAELVFGIGALI